MCTLAPLCVFALLTLAGNCESAEHKINFNTAMGHGKVELPAGCLYEGHWYPVGAVVRTRAACLSCACAGGALSCRRRSCPPLPVAPTRCHTLHRRDDCCPHIHCPDGVEFTATEVSPQESPSELQPTALALPACVEGGTVYAAGSAMSSNTACEQCFCLAGARRCVRPQCLPAQPGCQPQPTPGACCPQRYYCEHPTTLPTLDRNPNDCQTDDGQWVEEGRRVTSAESSCTRCFCLRGRIQCQHLSCAPNIHGCSPLVQPGQCCPHQYLCNHTKQDIPSQHFLESFGNYLESSKTEDRSFHSSKSTKRETTIKHFSTAGDNNSSTVSSDKLPSTTQVFEASLSTIVESTQTEVDSNEDPTTMTEISTTQMTTDSSTTEQPENSVKIIINGTINCTSELSSTSFYNITSINDVLKMHAETQPRIPFTDETGIEAETFPPDEIVTDRSHSQEIDDSESYVINVTSSLRTNATFTSPASTTSLPKTDLPMADPHNISKKTKEDPDYDYNEPTLPPSLPNLKIIPFVAADAVVDEELASKDSSYPVLERDEEFPVYHPHTNKNYPKRREDVYIPTPYPNFTSKDESDYVLTHQIEDIFADKVKDIEKPMEFTIGASFNNAQEKSDNEVPLIGSMEMGKPEKNFFSPPIQTEGGFIPKGPGLVEDYYLYPSTPSGLVVPHLTTRDQDHKGECITNDGRRIGEGETVNQTCSSCTCAWGQLHCSPLPCEVPLGCFRRTALLHLCCGELICDNDNHTESTANSKVSNSTQKYSQDINDKKSNSAVNEAEISITTPNSAQFDDIVKSDSVIKNHKHATTSSIIATTMRSPNTTIPLIQSEASQAQGNDSKTPLEDYEDEESDEGFSFGNVLQLLLSETYETTSTAPFKKMPANVMPYPSKRPTYPPTTTTKKPLQAQHSSYKTVNKIDHLVLGEATAIRNTTPRPVTTKVMITTRKTFTKPTQRPTTAKSVEMISKGTGLTMEARPPDMMPGVMAGLPKVAGCNIYGRMYRLGATIAELSTPCQQCKCTELGVQCPPLAC